MQISTSVWALARISEVFCFFVGLVKLWEIFLLKFVVKLQQVSENATQNLFSSYSQEVELCHVEVLYQCFASPVKIEECFLFREAARGFPNFRSRWALYTT